MTTETQTPSRTDECPMQAEPVAEHQWLTQLAGDWTYNMEGTMGPDQPPFKTSGTERFRTLGDLWVVGEGEGPMPDGRSAFTMMTLGYDVKKKAFVGTFVASMSDHLWVYHTGSLDATRKVLTMENTGPKMTGEGTATYRDVIEILDENRRTLTSFGLDEEGQWYQFMKATYTRRR